jgi:6-phosphogluconolactonase
VQPSYWYCSCSADGTIAGYRFDNRTGRLDPVGVTLIPDAQTKTRSVPLALVGRSMLYAAVRAAPTRIAAFRIGAEGTLSFTGSAPTAGSLAYLTSDASGRFLLGASLPDSLVVCQRIEASGAPGEPLQVIRDIAGAHSIVLDADNSHAYAAARDDNAICVFHFDARLGMLAPASAPRMPLHRGAGPRHLALHPSRTLLLCLNETDGTLTALRVDPHSGAVDPVNTVPVPIAAATRPANVRTADLAITPNGRFAYATERTTNTMSTFHIDAAGKIGMIDTRPVESSPRGIRMSDDGRWLAVAGELSGSLCVYAVDASSGALTEHGRYPAGTGANWIVMVQASDQEI